MKKNGESHGGENRQYHVPEAAEEPLSRYQSHILLG